jgi:uncharacterized protein (TIGR02246 family)
MNDNSGVERVVFSYFDAFGRGDVEAILAHYADDAVFMPADLPSVSGQDHLRAAYARTLARVRILPGGQSVAEDVITLGEFAWVRTDSRAVAADPRTGEQADGHFREVFLMRRVSGDWKIWRYMFNTIAGDA